MDTHAEQQTQPGHRRIGGTQADQRRGVEIAFRTLPFPSKTAPACSLALGSQPFALGPTRRGERPKIRVGRSGLRNEADAIRQNNDAAAAALA